LPAEFVQTESEDRFYKVLVGLLKDIGIVVGSRHHPYPVARGYPVDLHVLYTCVVSEGGFEKVALMYDTMS